MARSQKLCPRVPQSKKKPRVTLTLALTSSLNGHALNEMNAEAATATVIVPAPLAPGCLLAKIRSWNGDQIRCSRTCIGFMWRRLGTYVPPCVYGWGVLCLIQKPGNDRVSSFFIIVAHEAPATRGEELGVAEAPGSPSSSPPLFFFFVFILYSSPFLTFSFGW